MLIFVIGFPLERIAQDYLKNVNIYDILKQSTTMIKDFDILNPTKNDGCIDPERLQLATEKWNHCHEYYTSCEDLEEAKKIAPKGNFS